MTADKEREALGICSLYLKLFAHCFKVEQLLELPLLSPPNHF